MTTLWESERLWTYLQITDVDYQKQKLLDSIGKMCCRLPVHYVLLVLLLQSSREYYIIDLIGVDALGSADTI